MENCIKVNVVGKGCSWTKELSTSFILDDKLMFDAPEESFKTLYTHYDLSKIENIIISHIHNDHFIALHLILNFLQTSQPDKIINIIGPKNCKQRIIQLLKCINEEHVISFVKHNVNFIPCRNGKTITLNEYHITPYKMLHLHYESYGFVITKDNVKIGFSGDTAMCPNLHTILNQVDYIFIDSANIKINKKHLTCFEVEELSKSYKNVLFYPVHFSDASKKAISKTLPILKQGEIVNCCNKK